MSPLKVSIWKNIELSKLEKKLVIMESNWGFSFVYYIWCQIVSNKLSKSFFFYFADPFHLIKETRNLLNTDKWLANKYKTVPRLKKGIKESDYDFSERKRQWSSIIYITLHWVLTKRIGKHGYLLFSTECLVCLPSLVSMKVILILHSAKFKEFWLSKLENTSKCHLRCQTNIAWMAPT